jgi:outer membrane protein
MWSSSKMLVPTLAMCFAISAQADQPWTFERVISFAATNSPDARVAEHRIAVAQAALQEANAAFRPSLQFRSSYTRTDNPMQVFGAALNQRAFSSSLDFNNVPDADNLNAGGVLAVPLYTGGKLSANRDAASATAKAAGYASEVIRKALEFEAARAFHTILKSREFIRAAKTEVVALETNITIAHNRFNAGAILKSEVLDVEVRLAEARENLIRATNATTLAERALKNLLGFEGGDLRIADSVPVQDDATAPLVPLTRPEIDAVREEQRVAEAEVRSARSGYKPRISAFGSLDYDHGWTFNGSGESYTAGVMLQWDIFDGKRTRAKVSQAQGELAVAREQERKIKLAIDYEVEAARLALNEAQERLRVSGKSVELAAESAQLTRNRFTEGAALAAQLIDAESTLTGARVRRAEAEADQRIAVAALRKALGHSQLPEKMK